ncbi:transketolase [Bacillus sp. FJAT-22090]|uniref:transketolase n=1 Tax=Bacillus sp. FJAT-22090 TaxID=1581038 RepID=UPI00119DCA8F|nr:transketolase [Bacillus sp. FJAT-22090]
MNNSASMICELETIAREVRKRILYTAHYNKQGHVGGSLSCADILVALYFNQLSIDPLNPRWEDRDRFVLSKGHTALGLYATFALRGYIPEEELKTFDQYQSRLQAHPDMTGLDSLDMSTGSLGQGLSAAVGMAIGAKRLKTDFQVYCLIGDGESQEGQIWEAANIAEKYKLDNLIVILDLNGLQQYGWKNELVRNPPEMNAKGKFESFGFETWEINGHSMTEIVAALAKAKANLNGMPKAIIANTIKGKGVSFMENNYHWHSKAPNEEEYELALNELGGKPGCL